MADLEITFNTVSLPANTSGTLTVREDVGDDGTIDNTASTSLSDGVTSYTLSGFDGSSGNAIEPEVSLDNSDDVSTAAVSEPLASGLATPRDLTVSDVTDAPAVSLRWIGSVTADNYNVYRATSPGSTLADYTLIESVSADTTTYTDTTVSLGTRYYYRVTAENTNGETSPSSEVRGEPNADDYTESITWDTETEWGYGEFSDTTTDGSGTLTLGDYPQDSLTFDYSLTANEDSTESGSTTVRATIRDASSGTTLASDSIQLSNDGDSRTGTFSIDISTHPDLEFEAYVDLDNSGSNSSGDASISGTVDYSSGTIVSASRNSNAGTSTDTQTNTYTYPESGSWTSAYWDYTNTTTATKLSWSGVTLPNAGDDVSVTVENSDASSTFTQSLSSGSGSVLFDVAADDKYRLIVDVTTVDDSTTPELGALTLETHTPPTNLSITDTRSTEVDFSWTGVSVSDGYEIYYATSSGVDDTATLGFDTTNSGTTTGTVSGLSQGTTYHFNIRAQYSGE